MSYHAYLDNIKSKTGKTPEQLKDAAIKTGVYSSDMKVTELINFLEKEYGLGRGHSMAIWKYFKDHDWVKK